MKYMIEVTDTVNGEANYAWVRRKEVTLPDALSRYALVRRCKREIDWNGKRTTTVDYGDTIELRPYGECTVAFITCAD